MTNIIENIKHTRKFIVDGLNDFTIKELNTIPPGFNNNIIWNLGHLVAAQQDLCYQRAGLNMHIDESYFDKYKRGSKPEAPVTETELALIKKLHIETLDLLIADYKTQLFENYTPFVTRYGVELKNINDAIHFVLYHEGLHGGIIMMLKRLVK